MRPVLVFAALLLISQATVPSLSFAVDEQGPGKGTEMKEKHLERLTKELNLTPDQQKTVKAALDTKQEKMKAAQEESENQINAVLNNEQKTKYAQMKKDMKEHRQERREHLKEKGK